MRLSIVTSLYRSEPYLRRFHERSVAAASEITDDFELVLVNDGSPDGSRELALQLQREDSRIVVIDLSRNFGQHKALMTGLAHAHGELVFLLDSDLEEDPEWLNAFYERYRQGDCDVVFGVQARRKGGWSERWTGNVFYWALNRLTDVDIPANVVAARLMSSRYVKSLLEYREREVFLAGLWHITGYAQVPMTVVKHFKGETTYDLRRKLSLLVNSITSFSNRPLKGIFYTGVLISAISALWVIYLVWARLYHKIPVDGWTSLIVSLWLIGGLIILFLGVIGIYLSRMFIEVKQRPYTTIRQVYGAPDER
jgi:putative glycosyltransferase